MIYGTLEGANAYHAARLNAAWTGADDAKNAARLRASEYIDATFRTAFQGYQTAGRAQPRQWPRTDAYVWERLSWVLIPKDQVPIEVEYATYEAALRELASPGSLTPDITPGKNKKSVSVSGAVSVEYWSDDMKPMIEKIGMVLAPLIASDGQSSNPLSGKVTIA